VSAELDLDDQIDVLDVREAAKLLRIGRNALYDCCARNEIPHRRLGKQIRFSRRALLSWLEGSARHVSGSLTWSPQVAQERH
jgi:excisionase family DNA binding protein